MCNYIYSWCMLAELREVMLGLRGVEGAALASTPSPTRYSTLISGIATFNSNLTGIYVIVAS